MDFPLPVVVPGGADMKHRLPTLRTYLLVWGALLLLLGLNLGSAYSAMRGFNVAVNLGVAVIQMLLVMVFFMHLRREGSLLRIFSSIGFVWLLILLTLSLADYFSRIPISSPW